MRDNQSRDLLTEAEEGLRSILSPAAGGSSRAPTPLKFEEFHDDAVAVVADRGNTAGKERLDLRIDLGRTYLRPNDARQLRNGSVILLDKSSAEPVNVYAGGRLVARGEAMVLDDKLGIRIVELVGP